LSFDLLGQFFWQLVAVLLRDLDKLDVPSTFGLVNKPVTSFSDSCEEICGLGEEFDYPGSELMR
jgi:hypothetical protein